MLAQSRIDGDPQDCTTMSAVIADTSTMAEHTKCRKPRSQNHLPSSAAAAKRKNFTTATFRGLGCTASSKVSVPAVIRTSANWNANKEKKKKAKDKKTNNNNNKLHTDNSTDAVIVSNNIKNNNSPSSNSSQPLAVSSNCGGLPDVRRGPGIRLTGDAASENCVVSRPAVSARNKADGVHRIIHSQREHSSYNTRRMVTSEDIPFRDPGIALGMQRSRADVLGSRYHCHLRHDFHDGFEEIVTIQSSLLMGGRSERSDQYRGWRLDVDNMSYEELLELGERIGHVSTGLREDEISCCLRRIKFPILDNLSSNFLTETEMKCSICQEEYETDDETGKLNCGHFYHIQCIKQWLLQKNICPICKKSAMPQT